MRCAGKGDAGGLRMVSIDASGVEACLLEAGLLACKDTDMEFDTVHITIFNVPKATALSNSYHHSGMVVHSVLRL